MSILHPHLLITRKLGLDNLKNIITEFNISTFDERFIISRFAIKPPIFKEYLFVQVGRFHVLHYPETITKMHPKFGNKEDWDILNTYNQDRNIWMLKIETELDAMSDITSNFNKINEPFMNTRYLKILHNHQLYKAAIDPDFRKNFIAGIDRGHFW